MNIGLNYFNISAEGSFLNTVVENGSIQQAYFFAP
jgi:hypothetical protein